MDILLVGKILSNADHAAECGVYNALIELGHKVEIYDLGLQKPEESLTKQYDWILCMGAGLPPQMFKNNHNVVQIIRNNFSILWCSEPIRLSNYMSRFKDQCELFNLHCTFDEGEKDLYANNGARHVLFLPQAFNPNWYKPLDIEPKKFACFIGSVGGKWKNRVQLIKRVQKILPAKDLTVTTVFDAVKVNEIYQEHHIVLNLGLYHKDLGAPTYLSSHAFQQRIFETIGAGSIPFTNWPADISVTVEQRRMFTNGTNIIYYDNGNFDALLRFYYNNKGMLQKIRNNVIEIRDQHNYTSRMVTLMDKLKQFDII